MNSYPNLRKYAAEQKALGTCAEFIKIIQLKT